MGIQHLLGRLIRGIGPNDVDTDASVSRTPSKPARYAASDFISSAALTDDEMAELAEFGSVLRADGSAWTAWRRDSSGIQWLRRLP